MEKTNQYFEQSNNLALEAFNNSHKNLLGGMVKALQTETSVYKDYFLSCGQFLIEMIDHRQAISQDGYFKTNDFDTLLEYNHKLFEDILPENYESSYVNPTFAVARFGKAMGQVLSSVAYLLREYVGYCYENRILEMYRLNTIVLSLYEALIIRECEDLESIKLNIRDGLLRNIDEVTRNNWLRQLSPEFNTYSHIVDSYDLDDLRYLFRYGMYVDKNEIEMANYLSSVSEDKIKLIVDTFTEAYVRGFKRKGISLEGKKSTLVTYHVGFERIIAKAYENLRALGLEPIVFYSLRGVIRPRLYNTRPNKQMEYDHRYSDAIFFDDVYERRLMKANEKALSSLGGGIAKEYAGLALMEIFGEASFEPKNSDANITYKQSTLDLKTKYSSAAMAVYRQYVKGDDYNFTINAYPLPTIGEDFEAIFDEVVKVNTLEEALYDRIHTTMIDALDQSEYVKIKGGRNGNETDLTVALQTLDDPNNETKFSNCTADVNVPVGEVFTTPKLKGTNGLLHVKEVYLKSLRYLELKIWFEDGMISKYDCANFGDNHELIRIL